MERAIALAEKLLLLAKTNPNHDEQGRFASGEGQGGGHGMWVRGENKDIEHEYKIEYTHHTPPGNPFPTMESFKEAVANAKPTEITREMDSKIAYRSGTTSYGQLRGLLSSYASWPQYRNDASLKALSDRIKAGEPTHMPMVIQYPSGSMRVLSGNTRMDLAFQHGRNPVALVLKAPAKVGKMLRLNRLVAKIGRLMAHQLHDDYIIRFLKKGEDAPAAMAEGIDVAELEDICRKKKTEWSNGHPVTEAQRRAACSAWTSSKKANPYHGDEFGRPVKKSNPNHDESGRFSSGGGGSSKINNLHGRELANAPTTFSTSATPLVSGKTGFYANREAGRAAMKQASEELKSKGYSVTGRSANSIHHAGPGLPLASVTMDRAGLISQDARSVSVYREGYIPGGGYTLPDRVKKANPNHGVRRTCP